MNKEKNIDNPKVIQEFVGEYYFLSNYYETPVTYKGITYQNNEAAFQAQKLLIKTESINLLS